MTLSLARELVSLLPAGSDHLFNPWRDRCANDADTDGPEQRLARLAAHLDCQPDWILCGEAPGYAGCRHSGIAFTSERLLLEGAIPRVAPLGRRITTRALPLSEQSATIVWRHLYLHGIAERTVLWNALQMHPVGSRGVWSNRTPTPAELAMGAPAMRRLLEAFPRARVIAVGRNAEAILASMGVAPHGQIRHPANGGAPAFSAGLGALLS